MRIRPRKHGGDGTSFWALLEDGDGTDDVMVMMISPPLNGSGE